MEDNGTQKITAGSSKPLYLVYELRIARKRLAINFSHGKTVSFCILFFLYSQNNLVYSEMCHLLSETLMIKNVVWRLSQSCNFVHEEKAVARAL